MSKTEPVAFKALPLRLQQAMRRLPEGAKLVVALSGGLDSTVLLYAAHAFKVEKGGSLRAIHVNHGLSPNADLWQRHCQQMCKELGISLHCEKVEVKRNGEGIEAAARNARYAVFAQQVRPEEILLQGHHLNDQAETVLMRMLRGAGPEGLAAIPPARQLGEAILMRPLLELPRDDLESFARQQHWAWVEDESNLDTAFDRNFIRKEVLPVLEGRWSMVLDSLAQVAQRAGQAQHLIEQWCADHLPAMLDNPHAEQRALNLHVLARFDAIQQRALVRYWLDQLQIAHPAAPIFERIWSELIPAAEDASPLLQWGIHQLRRYDHCLFYTTEPSTRSWHIDKEISQPLERLPLRISVADTIEVAMDRVPTGKAIAEGVLILRVPESLKTLRIATRVGGESMRIEEGASSQSLKKLFQRRGLPPWEREHQLLIYFDDELVAAGDQLIAAGWRPQIGQPVLVIETIINGQSL